MDAPEKLYHAIFENSGVGMILIREDGTIALTNREFEKMSGYKKEAIVDTMRWIDFVDAREDVTRLTTHHQQLRKDPDAGQVSFDAQITTAQGHSIHALLRITIVPGTTYTLASLIDVTEKKTAEKKLSQNELRFKNITANLPGVVYQVFANYQGEYKMTYISESVTDIFGLPADCETFVDEFVKNVHEDDKKSIAQSIVKAVYGKTKWSIEGRYIKKSGELIWFHGMSTVSNYEDGMLFDGILLDITKFKKLQEERRKLETQLFQTQKMDAIGKLAGGIAHDFNNILTGIQGNTALMLLKSKPGDDFHHRLTHINEQITRGAGLTQQLIGFARGGKYEVKTIHINHLLRKSVQFFMETKKEITTHIDLGKNIHTIEADAGQIEQVILNIFINAAHAMPNGGHLHIKTENLTIEQKESKLFKTQPGEFVRTSISDTGTGMSRETLARIFEPFFTTKADQGGIGLGLASAYGIIRNHGGTIRVYSEPGKGTTFTLLLPAARKKNIPENGQQQPEALPKGEGGILLVEDEVVILAATSDLLEMMGYTVYPATSGEEAISVYLNHKRDIRLVILDMIMPGMNGAEVFKTIKKDDPDVKFILTSGYSMQGEIQKIMDLGCDAFIQKPYNFMEFSKRVHRILYPHAAEIN